MEKFQNIKNIAILLPTYNGSKYVRELIDSILAQSLQDFTLYIRDDGSKDKTLDIVSKYANDNANVVCIPSEGNLGPRYVFFAMMEIVDSNYYMFCDQDDVWMPSKVEDTFMKLKETEQLYPNKPVIVHTDLRIVDGELNLIAESLWKYRGYDVDLPHTFPYLCHYNDITGCTMMINSLAKQASKGALGLKLPDFMYHDNLISILATRKGGIVVPLKKATIIYRRHGDNETDALKFGSSIVHRLREIGSYLKMQKQRHAFFRELGYGSFAKFMYYKTKLYIIKIWKKKQD